MRESDTTLDRLMKQRNTSSKIQLPALSFEYDVLGLSSNCFSFVTVCLPWIFSEIIDVEVFEWTAAL